jgi:hypothetical protein
MDILAHTLWPSSGLLLWRGQGSLSPKTILLTSALAAMPDLHLLPVAVWSAFNETSLLSLRQYVFASPDKQPLLTPFIALLAHHMHCIVNYSVLAAVLIWIGIERIGRSNRLGRPGDVG